MAESSSLASLGELSRPATVLIEKISDAVGGIFRPYQIRRVAEAEAHAGILQAKANIEISDLQRRAMQRFLVEEGQKQENIENISLKALPSVSPDAHPENIEKDWLSNFFDKSRLISDDEMQALWARVLAGEANRPGFCSKRTIDLLSSMDKAEAELFRSLCTFIWDIDDPVPIILDVMDPIYRGAGINFNSLQHLELAGLVKFDNFAGFALLELKHGLVVGYHGERFKLTLPTSDTTDFPLGKALLTTPGKELAMISGSVANLGFRDYVLEQWKIYNPSPF